MPVLFLHGAYDTTCETMPVRFAEPMRHYCTDLTEVVVNSGHWMAQEQPVAVNAALAKWLAKNCRNTGRPDDAYFRSCSVARDLGPAGRHSRNRRLHRRTKPPVQDRPLPTLNMVVRSATLMPFMPITVRRSGAGPLPAPLVKKSNVCSPPQLGKQVWKTGPAAARWRHGEALPAALIGKISSSPPAPVSARRNYILIVGLGSRNVAALVADLQALLSGASAPACRSRLSFGHIVLAWLILLTAACRRRPPRLLGHGEDVDFGRYAAGSSSVPTRTKRSASPAPA